MTFFNYLIGFILSLALTFAAYAMATHHSLPYLPLLSALLLVACAQFVVQCIFFLHLGSGARDRLFMLVWTGIIVLILVFGSVWVMTNLNQRMMPSDQQMQQYMDTQSGI